MLAMRRIVFPARRTVESRRRLGQRELRHEITFANEQSAEHSTATVGPARSIQFHSEPQFANLPAGHSSVLQGKLLVLLLETFLNESLALQDPSGRYIVLYTFIARDENDVSVERGEFVTVLNREDPDWYWVVRSDGQEGFVPSAFVYPAEAIQSNVNEILPGNALRR